MQQTLFIEGIFFGVKVFDELEEAIVSFESWRRMAMVVRNDLCKKVLDDSCGEVEAGNCFEEVSGSRLDTELVTAVVMVLEDALEMGSQGGTDTSSVPRCFFSKGKYTFTLRWYVERLVELAECSQAAFVLALIYMERMLDAEGRALVETNVHRLFVASLVVAVKFLDDEVHRNTFFASLAGLKTAKEVSYLEIEMLSMLKFDLYVHPDTFFEYHAELFRSARERGFTD